jgi:hypothetical protein
MIISKNLEEEFVSYISKGPTVKKWPKDFNPDLQSLSWKMDCSIHYQLSNPTIPLSKKSTMTSCKTLRQG